MNCDWVSVFYSLYDHVMHFILFLLVNNWGCQENPFHAESWFCVLLPVNLFTCPMFETGVFWAVDFSSLLPPLSKLKHVVGIKFRINICLHKSIKWMRLKKNNKKKNKHDKNLLVLFLICFWCAQNYSILLCFTQHPSLFLCIQLVK